MDPQEVTIIIPVRDREQIVGRTLESVAAQTRRPLRLILVDNGSIDGTMDVLKQFKEDNEGDDFPIDILSEPRPGASAARNTGLRSAHTPWVMFFDSDDTMEPELVEDYMSLISRAQGGVDMVVTRCDAVLPSGRCRRLPYFESDDPIKYHLIDAIIATQRFIAKHELFVNVGGWNETLPRWNDWELGVRLLLANPRIAYMGDKTSVHTFFTPQSITGISRFKHYGEWERSIDAIEQSLKQSDVPDKERYIRYVEFRRILLAGQYALEGHRQQADQLYRAVYARTRTHKRMKWLFPLLYKHISIGLPGASRIAKSLL